MLEQNMSQPVILSDQLVNEAQIVASLAQRSIANQIEIWASLGKAIEPLLGSEHPTRKPDQSEIRLLSQAISEVETSQGQTLLQATLDRRPFPHYRAVPGRPELICRIAEDGTETIGRFVGREFESIDVNA